VPKIPVTAETLNNLGDGYAGKAIDARRLTELIGALDRDTCDAIKMYRGQP
jgi:hypothetical protein